MAAQRSSQAAAQGAARGRLRRACRWRRALAASWRMGRPRRRARRTSRIVVDPVHAERPLIAAQRAVGPQIPASRRGLYSSRADNPGRRWPLGGLVADFQRLTSLDR